LGWYFKWAIKFNGHCKKKKKKKKIKKKKLKKKKKKFFFGLEFKKGKKN